MNEWIAEIDRLTRENKKLLEALKNLLTELPLLWGDHIKYGAMLLKLHNDDIEDACMLIAKVEAK